MKPQHVILEAKFKDIVQDVGDDDTMGDTKKQVINFITSNFYRFINQPDTGDIRGMLLLIAALSMINNADDSPSALQAARRLAQAALGRSGKKGK